MEKQSFYEQTRKKALEEIELLRGRIDRLEQRVKEAPEQDVIFAFLLGVTEKSMTDLSYYVGMMNGSAMSKYDERDQN